MKFVTCALEAVDAEEVDAELDRAGRVPDRRAFVQDRAPGRFELLDDGARAVAGRFDDADAAVDDGLRVALQFGGVRH